MKVSISEKRFAGYSYLIDKYNLTTMPHWHISSITETGVRRTIVNDEQIEDIYPSKYWPGNTIGGHLEFALKYDGVNLSYLNLIFKSVPEADIVDYVKSKPTGKYARRIWFFYEFLTGKVLQIKDLSTGNYTEAIEPELYFIVTPGVKIKRQRIVNNMLGNKNFCPVVRKTEKLLTIDSVDLRKMCEDIIALYSPQLVRRALSYLYNKETKSSFAIENIKPNPSRTEKFITLLESAELQDFCDKDRLIDLQNRIVDPRFRDHEYRKTQNYVGQTISYQKEIIHYISPKPEDLPDLMSGLLAAHHVMKEGSLSAVIHAAVIAYGFVFLHPFEDGNGRIHRFLIHNILSIQGLVPKGLMFPVSAVIVKNPDDYDNSLEKFSRPLMQLAEYALDEVGQMTVLNDTSDLYKYIDMTGQAEALYDFVVRTIKNELAEELNFLANYDNTKKAIQAIIDMPDRLIDLFIQLCLQNNGDLSARKRTSHFKFLTDDELSIIEQAVKAEYKL